MLDLNRLRTIAFCFCKVLSDQSDNIISISYSLDCPRKAVANFDNIMEDDSDILVDNFLLQLGA